MEKYGNEIKTLEDLFRLFFAGFCFYLDWTRIYSVFDKYGMSLIYIII
jgi:hypothetical protein